MDPNVVLGPQHSSDALEREPHARPESVVAVPSYVLDGRVISLGNPRQTQLFLDLARLLATPSVTED